MIKHYFSLGIILLFPLLSYCQIFVDASRPDDSGDGLSLATAKRTINAGITVATVGQTVFIATGSYDACILNKSVNLQGSGVGLTIIQGSGSGNGINITSSISNVTIENLTVTNFFNGMNVSTASLTISNLTLQNISLSNNIRYGLYSDNNVSYSGLNIIDSQFNNNNGVTFGRGVWIQGAGASHSNINITNSQFNSNALVGFDLSIHTSLNNFTVTGSEFRNNGDAGLSFYKGHTSPATCQILISNNIVEMTNNCRFGIEIKNAVGTGLSIGNGSVTVSDNRVFQSSIGNNSRDVAGIAVICRREGTASFPEPSGVVIINNSVENIQPGDGTCGTCGGNIGNGFGIVAGGNNHRIFNNSIVGTQVGIQLQGGNINAGTATSSPSTTGTINTLYFDRDNSTTCNGNVIRYNNITGYTGKALRNVQNGGFTNNIVDYTGNWFGNVAFTLTDVESYLVSDPAIATFSAVPNNNAAFNPWAAVDLDDISGTNTGQRGIQINSIKTYRATATETSTSIGVIPQGILIANTLFKDILDIRDGVYNISDNIIINKAITLLGNGGAGTHPRLVMQPIPATVQSLLVVSAANITINRLHLQVLGEKGTSTTGSHGIFVANHTTSLSYNNLDIQNNLIENISPIITPTTPLNFYSFAIRLSQDGNGLGTGNNTFTISNNTIFSQVTNNFFGRGIRSIGNHGTISNNMITAASYGAQIASIQGNTLQISNNTFNILLEAGVEINLPQFDGTHTINDNIFNSISPDIAYPFSLIELKDIGNFGAASNASVVISGNNFNDHSNSAIYSGRSRNLTILNNVFTPRATASNFYHLFINTKHRTTGATGAAITCNNITIQGNMFNGNGIGGTGVFFANHHSGATPAFDNIMIGGIGVENSFLNNLNTFIGLDPYFGTSNALTLTLPLNASATNPWLAVWANPFSPVTATTMGVTTGNFNAQNNNFDIGTGLKTPAVMTNIELIALENKIAHSIDYASLGFVTVKPNHIFVTQQSFIAPNFTLQPRIQRGTAIPTTDGFTINVEGFTYIDTPTEIPTTSFNMDFVPVITDIINYPNVISPNWQMNGTGKTFNLLGDLTISNQITFTDGNIQTNANTLNFTTTAINPSANTATVGEKDNSRILGRARTIRNIGIGALDFLGLNLPVGADLGTLDLLRVSDADGIAVTPSGTSIACTWFIEPTVANGRNGVIFRWLPALNNGKDDTQLQAWRNNGTTWEPRSNIFAASSTNPLYETIGIDITTFSPWTISDILNPLPVELLYLKAQLNQNQNPEVYWATSSEINADYFEIERSLDAKNFIKIGRVQAKNVVSEQNFYVFEDKFFTQKNNTVLYYRLKQFDKNGKYTYSKIVDLTFNEKIDNFIELIYPNPTTGLFKVKTFSKENINVYILNSEGIVCNKSIINQTETLFNISHLPKGIYILLFENKNHLKSHKIVLN